MPALHPLAPPADDAELVHASRSGSRDAFGQIVARYQTLICSLTYSATGSLGRSEDLAQDTFVTAWKQLPALREPARLRAWLCGIARNLAHNSQRRAGREPVTHAGSLDAAAEQPSPEPLPAQQAITREEESILWRALAEMPATYREPMVLYYREHQSVEAVAHALDLSEDAVKQRLSRGRRLLQAEVAAFVEGTLGRTRPGRAFTLQVVAAVPLAASSGIAVGGATALEGSLSGKGAAAAVLSGTLLTAGLLWFLSHLLATLFLGACLGYVMSRAAERSASHCASVAAFWRTVAAGVAVFVLPGLLGRWSVTAPLLGPVVAGAFVAWLGLFHVLVPVATLRWVAQWLRPETARPASAAVAAATRALPRWLALGVALPAFFCGAFLWQLLVHPTLTAQRITAAEAVELVAARPDATFTLQLYHGEPRHLRIRVPETPRMVRSTPATPAVLEALRQHGRPAEAREFMEQPLSFRWLFALSCFVAPAGLVLLARRPWQRTPVALDSPPTPAERVAARFLAATTAIALLVGAGGLALMTRWSDRSISAAEAHAIIAERGDATFLLSEMADGTARLGITLRTPEGVTRLHAPADAAAVGLLQQHARDYRRIVQGPDFTFADPAPVLSALLIAALTSTAIVLLWWAGRRSPPPVTRQ